MLFSYLLSFYLQGRRGADFGHGFAHSTRLSSSSTLHTLLLLHLPINRSVPIRIPVLLSKKMVQTRAGRCHMPICHCHRIT
jgi:hypothetical protein